MGTILDARRFAKLNVPQVSRTALNGCKGPACPAFDLCQGRCATRQSQPRIHPDGGVWIEPRG